MSDQVRRERLLNIADDYRQSTRFNRNSARSSFVATAAFAGGLAVSSEALISGDIVGIPGIIFSGTLAYLTFKDGLEEMGGAIRSERIAAVAEYQAGQPRPEL